MATSRYVVSPPWLIADWGAGSSSMVSSSTPDRSSGFLPYLLTALNCNVAITYVSIKKRETRKRVESLYCASVP